MKLNILQWSLKTRITLFTLAIFVLSIWSLSFYASHMLRTDMEHMLSEQQFSTVSLVAADINEEFENRFKYLHAIAASISPAMLRNTAELQSFLEQKKILGIMFNAGAFITRTDGTAIASTPRWGERIGVSYMDRDHIIAVLKEGKATIGLPVIGKKLHSPLIPMGVPIRDAKGNVIGSLTGATNLGMPNFLNKVSESRYGKSGGYVLLVPQHRLIVTASDKSRIMQSLPAPGVVPTLDRFLDGYEGSAVYINPLGVQVLGSAKKIPTANWLMGVTLPITEAFAPIHEMQQRVILAALFLTLLAGGLTWWMLRRQLSPMFSAVETLGSLSNNMQSTQLLSITRQDEIGTLIGSFNHLLQTLMQREQALITSTARLNEAQHIAQIGNWTLNLPDGELIWSDEIFRIFEIDPTRFDATYDAFLNTIHPDDRNAVNQAYSDSLSTRKPYEITHRLLMSDGRIKWVQEKCTSDFDAAGKPLQSRGMVQDITAVKLTELALIAARDEAERANRAKSEFLSSMSHELRTPMNAILGFSQLMRYDNNFPDVHKGNVTEILNAGHHLLELINELLDLSQIESGHFNLLMEPVEVCSVIDECLSLLGVMADKRNIHLSHIGLKGAMVLADRTRLKQVLLNLLSNAIKYNREGGSVRIEILQHDTNRLRLVVTDTGLGIPAARLAELFQPFNRLGAENSNILV